MSEARLAPNVGRYLVFRGFLYFYMRVACIIQNDIYIYLYTLCIIIKHIT